MRGLWQAGVTCWTAARQQGVEEKLQAELAAGLDACAAEVGAFMRPLEAATAATVERLRDADARLAALASELEALQQRAANIE
jgi:hypothetical protein